MKTNCRKVKLEFEHQPIVLDPICRIKMWEYDEPFSLIDHVNIILANQVVYPFVGTSLPDMILNRDIIMNFYKTHIGNTSDIGDI